MKKYDVIVVGAGAAGLMAATAAGSRGRKVLLIESTNKIGEKIRISGGGRCNFTNLNTKEHNYLSNNPHFIKSPLARFNQHDFIKLVESYKISYHEKTLGQLFCDGSSSQIIDMLINKCKKNNVEILLNACISLITRPKQFN
ncbi:MAG: NAD(P)/FAD-dependent oxidoreductase, partial [Pseudomonadota bacterium]